MDVRRTTDHGQYATSPASPPPAPAPSNHSRLFIVVGPVVPETIRIPSRQVVYTTVGGVGTQLASAPNGSNSRTVLRAAVPQSQAARGAAAILADQGVVVMPHPAKCGATHLVFDQDGEILKARGSWPPTPAISRQSVQILDEADFLLIASEPAPGDIADYLNMAHSRGVPTMVVVSAAEKLDSLLAVSDRPKSVIAMNHFEFAQAARTSGARDPDAFMRAQRADALLVTQAEAGWTLHRPNRPDLKSPAPPAPANEMFLGCGVWAAAALAQALKREAGFKGRRWDVQRTHSWLNRFRRFLVRLENSQITTSPSCISPVASSPSAPPGYQDMRLDNVRVGVPQQSNHSAPDWDARHGSRPKSNEKRGAHYFCKQLPCPSNSGFSTSPERLPTNSRVCCCWALATVRPPRNFSHTIPMGSSAAAAGEWLWMDQDDVVPLAPGEYRPYQFQSNCASGLGADHEEQTMPFEHQPSFGEGGDIYDPTVADVFDDTITNALFANIVDSNVHEFALRRLSRTANAPDPVFILWLIGAGRFCLTVLRGRHVLLRDAWHLDTGAALKRIPSPFAEAWDEALLVSREVHWALKRRVSFMPAIYFPDVQPDEHIQQVAERSHVAAIWKPHGVTRRLADIVAAESQFDAPSRSQALEEMNSLINPNARPTGPP